MLYSQRRVILKFANEDLPESSKYVGIDRTSGGYPCRANILYANDFKTIEDGKKYAVSFKDFGEYSIQQEPL